MDLRHFYQLHCFADPDFYDTPERWDDARSRFSLAHEVPEGWSRFEEGVWVALHPLDVKLPWQGWKIHVSACLDNAEEVLGIVRDYCVARNISFKFLRSRGLLLLTNSKYGDRASSGKFCTLYPVREAELEGILADLGTKLDGQQGPYILSDLRWESGPVYVRYGGFARRYCMDETGELVLAVAGPDGRLVPDVRKPGFEVPSWVEVPAFLAERIAAGKSEPPPNFPYQIEEPLHFSNGGGVYLARDRHGQRVVLKEARPFAGLDNDGTDAVARLERERAILEELSDTDVVPHLLDHFKCWEHRFLVEEHVEGEGLRGAVNARHPETLGSGNGIAEYTVWALDVGERIERALEALHARGIVYGDLHPGNILIRPDGRVAFVDLEIASHLAEKRRPGLGAFGFAAPESCSGFDIDRYALACVRLWMFLTFAPALVSHAPIKAETFVGVLTERFGAPTTFANQMLRDLRVGLDGDDGRRSRGAVPRSTVGAGLLDTDAPDWVAVRRSMAEAIVASATPERADRLFPGDVNGFRYGGLGLAYGAAGVLYALAATGAGTDPVHVDWLVRTSRRAAQPYVGFYNGLHGVAYALDYLGRHDDAVNVLDQALAMTPDVPVRGLFGGLAGIGLNVLHFARLTGEGSLHEAALGVAEQLAEAVHDSTTSPDLPSAAGLMYGFCGAALLFVHLYEYTGDTTFLDLAATALGRDLELCQEGADGGLQVLEGGRLMPYLAIGSAGISVVISEYLQHRGDEDLTSAQRRFQRACDAEYVLFPGLFTGRAGLMASLGLARDRTGAAAANAAQAHLRRLAWHALPYQGRVAFTGDQSFRLSMDLATGTAGILLALNTVVGQPDPHEPRSFLPFLGPRQLAVRPSRTGVPVALPGRATSAPGPLKAHPGKGGETFDVHPRPAAAGQPHGR